MSIKPLRIASRRSPLAVAQARLVQQMLAKAANVPADKVEDAFPIKTYVTTGDQRLDPSLADIGGKGLFTKEVEQALLTGEADIAVHSMKDMPADMPPGLTLAAVPPREDPRDSFVTMAGRALTDMPAGARIGTSSVRRGAQARQLFPHLTVVPMRGNVQTRLDKLARGEADGTFLAEAGLLRLGRDDVVRQPVPTDQMLPAPGQGTLCIQCREDDERALTLCAEINCTATAICSAAERAVTMTLDGSCRTPLAAYARHTEGGLLIEGEILATDASAKWATIKTLSLLDLSHTDQLTRAAKSGSELGQTLLTQAGPALPTLFAR